MYVTHTCMLFEEVSCMLSEVSTRTQRAVGVCVHKTQEGCEVTDTLRERYGLFLKNNV